MTAIGRLYGPFHIYVSIRKHRLDSSFKANMQESSCTVTVPGSGPQAFAISPPVQAKNLCPAGYCDVPNSLIGQRNYPNSENFQRHAILRPREILTVRGEGPIEIVTVRFR